MGLGERKGARLRERWSRRVARAETDAHLVRDGHDAWMPVRGRAEFTVMMRATTRDEADVAQHFLAVTFCFCQTEDYKPKSRDASRRVSRG